MTTTDNQAVEALMQSADAYSRTHDRTVHMAARKQLRAAITAALAAERAAERERICTAIKAADDKASDCDYMLDSNDCIKVIRGTWAPES